MAVELIWWKQPKQNVLTRETGEKREESPLFSYLLSLPSKLSLPVVPLPLPSQPVILSSYLSPSPVTVSVVSVSDVAPSVCVCHYCSCTFQNFFRLYKLTWRKSGSRRKKLFIATETRVGAKCVPFFHLHEQFVSWSLNAVIFYNSGVLHTHVECLALQGNDKEIKKKTAIVISNLLSVPHSVWPNTSGPLT